MPNIIILTYLALGYDFDNLYIDEEDEIALMKKSEFERESILDER